MDRRLCGVFFCFSLLLLVANGQNTQSKCEIDADCSADHHCRLLCRRTCRSVCVRLKAQQQVLPAENQRQQAGSYEESTPFSPKGDIFVEEAAEDVTPLTISEMQLDEELLNSIKEDSLPPQRDEIVVQPADEVPPISPRGPRVEGGGHPPEPPRSRGPPAPASRTHHLRPNSRSGGRAEDLRPPPPNRREPQGNSIDDFDEQPQVQRISPPLSDPSEPVPIPPGPPAPPPSQTIRVAVPSLPPPRSRPSTPSPGSLRRGRPPPIPANWRSSALRGPPATPPPPPSEEKEGPKSECPPPPICERNCGVYIDETGCQSCRCLWLSTLCRRDSDCLYEGQFCDFGRCECRAGFVHSRTQSGICDRALPIPLRPARRPALKGTKIAASPRSSPAGTIVETFKPKARPRRSEVAEKPHREERLQWPGINQDCWSIPDKPLRSVRPELAGPSAAARRFHKAAGVRNLNLGDSLFPLSGDDLEPPAAAPPAAPPASAAHPSAARIVSRMKKAEEK
ncbi:hypothetical protein M3Y99_01549300 [Aphelenchoides fujianensis]|nr:hypothetical protein M3Y99_01549300 [Aphelenchoides fujianensis]